MMTILTGLQERGQGRSFSILMSTVMYSVEDVSFLRGTNCQTCNEIFIYRYPTFRIGMFGGISSCQMSEKPVMFYIGIVSK